METIELNEHIDENYIINQLFSTSDKNIGSPLWYQTISNPQISYDIPQNQLQGIFIIPTEI